jgi:hypothetical protein
MSNRKNYNSIVFLTTLSVYLGLVLVGGASPVLAQTTNRVIAKAESFEKKSLLCENFSTEAQYLFDKGFFIVPVEDFLKDLENLSKLGKFSPDAPFAEFFIYEFNVEDVDGRPVALYGKGANKPYRNRWFDAAFFDAVDKIAARLPNGEFRINKFANPYKNSFGQTIKFELNQNEFVAQTSFDVISADKGNQLVELYNASFALGECRSADAQKVAYQSTRATFQNNQVFIVTRLPRASIDEFLASKVAR